ncbi:MAG: hypothetical protein Q7S65_03140 [Nanoarchaeota archaeon]|nr:hypothetical protein [Nanoarchaeota archaeon]
MFDKVKNVMHAAEHMDKLTDKFEELIQTVQSHTEAVKSLKTEMDGLKDAQTKLSAGIKQDTSDFSGLKEDLKKEIADFKIIKSKMEKSIVESFEEQLKTELLPKFNKLETHVRKFEEMGDAVRVIGARVVKLSDDLAKFSEISASIKRVDFDLVNAAKQMKASDSEKLELMRKIDSLERLVSKMRRRQ